MKCDDCGTYMPIAKLVHISVRILESPEPDAAWIDDVFLCPDCHAAFDSFDILKALTPCIIGELRKARQPCASTREVGRG